MDLLNSNNGMDFIRIHEFDIKLSATLSENHTGLVENFVQMGIEPTTSGILVLRSTD